MTKGREWAQEHARASLELAESLDDDALRAGALSVLAALRFEMGDPEAPRLAERAYEAAAVVADEELLKDAGMGPRPCSCGRPKPAARARCSRASIGSGASVTSFGAHTRCGPVVGRASSRPLVAGGRVRRAQPGGRRPVRTGMAAALLSHRARRCPSRRTRASPRRCRARRRTGGQAGGAPGRTGGGAGARRLLERRRARSCRILRGCRANGRRAGVA